VLDEKSDDQPLVLVLVFGSAAIEAQHGPTRRLFLFTLYGTTSFFIFCATSYNMR
jgi:hypothetical protein